VVVWNTKVKTTFSRKYLWDLINPKGKKMSIGLIEVVNPKHQVGYDLKGST
jgi:hypothetical protein